MMKTSLYKVILQETVFPYEVRRVYIRAPDSALAVKIVRLKAGENWRVVLACEEEP